MLDLGALDLDEIANALSDQHDYEHRWLIDPQTGEVVFWTSDTGIDGQNPVELDELDLTPIDPLPSYVWYEDMADFAEGISDDSAGRRLARAIRGKGAFRRFKNELYEEYPELVSDWHAFRDRRAKRRAVEWLKDESLVADDEADKYLIDHPDPDLKATAAEYPQLLHTAIDTTDVRGLAEFYRLLLGLQYRQGDEPAVDGEADDADWLVLVDHNGARKLAFQQVERLEATTWPTHDVPMQMHLDFTVSSFEELQRQRKRAESLGAKLLLDRTDESDEPLYVLADPSGHPFCIFVA